MKHVPRLAAAACAAPLLLAFALPAQRISFAPAAGSSVTKTFETSVTLGIDEYSMLVNGQDPGMMPEIDMTVAWDQTVEVRDTYDAVAGGRPTKLTRSFEEIDLALEADISMDMMGETETNSASAGGSSSLEGETVVFTWDEDLEEHSRSYPEGESGDAGLLEGLWEDMDLRGFLPAGDVEVGEGWAIEPAAVVKTLVPGGDLSIEVEGGDFETGSDSAVGLLSDIDTILGDVLDGGATATFRESRESEGGRVAVIDVSVDVSSAQDMTDLFDELFGDSIPPEAEVSFDRIGLEFMLEGRGQLLWNLDANRIQSYDMTGEVVFVLDMEVSTYADQEVIVESYIEASGELRQKVEAE